MTNELSLENLRDIVEPPPVSWWPPAPGWWVVFAMVLFAAMIAGWNAWRRWRAERYRYEAQRLIVSSQSTTEIAAVLKRTALTAYPRTEVASLSGKSWLSWLDTTGRITMTASVANALVVDKYATADSPCTDELRQFAMDWVKSHQRHATTTPQPQTGSPS